MKKRDLIIYWVATALFSLMLFAGAIAYFVEYEMTRDMFASLGVPTEVIYPLAIVKILGVITIVFVPNSLLKQLAYLGFALELSLAVITHLKAGDGGAYGPLIPIVLLVVSFIYYRKKLQEKKA